MKIPQVMEMEVKEKKVRTGDEGILNTVILFLVAFIMFITINKRKNLNKK